MRVLIWATTLQADILALAFHLDQRRGCELLVVTEHASSFASSPIARLRPLAAPVLDRNDSDVESIVSRFEADVVVCDNHFPPFNAGRTVCSMWHGLGWKARPSNELRPFFKHIKRLTGIDARSPNPRFLAQCYHPRDLEWRTAQWGVAPENCVITGSCFADLLRDSPPYDRRQLEAEYQLDLSKKTVLVNVTWHYGRIFPGTWEPKVMGTAAFDDDLTFLRQMLRQIREHDANVLFCLHDRKRYERGYLAAVHELLAEFPDGVAIRHKDQHPDNWADLSIADVMVSNLSSFSTFFYHSGRPVLQLCPAAADAEIPFAQYSWLGLHRRLRKSSAPPWMNDPSDNGGLSARTPDEALAALETALTDPDCCKLRSAQWLAEHVSFPEPSACECLTNALERLVRA